jgi:hypothetical protein
VIWNWHSHFSYRAGCGYGDFLIWSSGTITPFEPLLFEHNMNYPNKTGYDENQFQDVSRMIFVEE